MYTIGVATEDVSSSCRRVSAIFECRSSEARKRGELMQIVKHTSTSLKAVINAEILITF